MSESCLRYRGVPPPGRFKGLPYQRLVIPGTSSDLLWMIYIRAARKITTFPEFVRGLTRTIGFGDVDTMGQFGFFDADKRIECGAIDRKL